MDDNRWNPAQIITIACMGLMIIGMCVILVGLIIDVVKISNIKIE